MPKAETIKPVLVPAPNPGAPAPPPPQIPLPYAMGRFDGYGLGRIPAEDRRDQRFAMASVLRPSETGAVLESRHWTVGEVTDQGTQPHCVAHAWTHFLLSSPVRTKQPSLAPLPEYPGVPFTAGLYKAAQQVDEWAGDSYDGTSVRAGAKVLQRLGRFGANPYVWAWNAETVRDYVIARGPVVIGVNWYNDMFDADPKGRQPLNVSGSLAGGHAVLVIGYSADRHHFTILNSWTEVRNGARMPWGYRGRARLTFSDMQQLLRDEGGEAVSAIEVAL